MNVLLHRYFIYDDAAGPFTSLRLSDLISFSNRIQIFLGHLCIKMEHAVTENLTLPFSFYLRSHMIAERASML